MKRTLFCLLALFGIAPLSAQVATEGGRIFRSHLLPYDTRHDAIASARVNIKHYADFKPQPRGVDPETGEIVLGSEVDIPYAWTDGMIFLRLEEVGSAYTLVVNGHIVAEIEDPFTPAEFDLSPWLTDGKNLIALRLRLSRTPALQDGIKLVRERFAGSCLFAQAKRSILDFTARLVPDSQKRFGVLDLRIVAQNRFSLPDSVTVAYDIYDPKGRLMEYSSRMVRLDANTTDTVRFDPFIYHTYEHRWGVDGCAPLYRMMLFIKRDGSMWEYMPFELAFTGVEFRDGKFYRFDKEFALNSVRCNAAETPEKTLAAMQALRKQGFNTLEPDAPQPDWYYSAADRAGLYVIDRANINASASPKTRTVGGTPSNDPALIDEYITRVKAMYYRSRNHSSVIAYALGGESGNGYAMYKAYEWLKSVEKVRPVLYRDAEGEWNSDF